MYNEKVMEHGERQFDLIAFVLKRKVDAWFVLAGIVFGTLLNWDVIEIAFFAVFIWSIVGPIQSRWLALPAFFFLAFTPILLLLDRETRAEEFAVYAYYFLVMAVIRGVIEVRAEKNDGDQIPEKP